MKREVMQKVIGVGVANFLIVLHFSQVSFNTSFDNMVPQSFELNMQGSHPSLYIAKKLYQFVYFGSILEVYRKC